MEDSRLIVHLTPHIICVRCMLLVLGKEGHTFVPLWSSLVGESRVCEMKNREPASSVSKGESTSRNILRDVP